MSWQPSVRKKCKKPNHCNGVDKNGLKKTNKKTKVDVNEPAAVSRLMAQCFLVASAVTAWEKTFILCLVCRFIIYYCCKRRSVKWESAKFHTVHNMAAAVRPLEGCLTTNILSLCMASEQIGRLSLKMWRKSKQDPVLCPVKHPTVWCVQYKAVPF